jgi:hypothetical protein
MSIPAQIRAGLTNVQNQTEPILDIIEDSIESSVEVLDRADEIVSERVDNIVSGLRMIPADAQETLGIDLIPDVVRGQSNEGLPQSISVIPYFEIEEGNLRTREEIRPGVANIFTLLQDEGGDTVVGTLTVKDQNGVKTESSVYGPFSRYTPSAIWPYMREDGRRYTAMDLANEPIESDFIGTKPLVELALNRRLDRVGAIPGFRYWGDVALGLGPLTVLTVGGIAAYFLVPPAIALTTSVWSATIGSITKNLVS